MHLHNFLKLLYVNKVEAAETYNFFFKIFSLANLPRKVQKLSFSVLWGLVLYEFFFNNFVLSFTFKYLFFYILFSFWVNFSFKLKEVDYFLVHMLWESYYNPAIIYVNFLQEEENDLKLAVEKDCKFIWKENQFSMHEHPYNKRFVKMPLEEAIQNDCPNGGYKNESWHYPRFNYTKCFDFNELVEFKGRFFVNDPEDIQPYLEYELLKKEQKRRVYS